MSSRQKNYIPLKTLLITGLIISVGVLAFAGYKLFEISRTYKNASDYYRQVEERVIGREDISQAKTDRDIMYTEEQNPKRYSSLVWNYAALKEMCVDAVGYIYQKDTKISYPVLQAQDNQKYLRHMMNGEYNIAGSIFMDYHYPGGLNAPFSIIYGHNMDDNSMFGSLTDYQNEVYYREHPVMELYVGDKCYEYYVFAALKTPIDSFIFDFVEDRQNLVDLAEKARNECAYKTQAPQITKESYVTVLTTCIDYPRDYTYRYAVFLVRGEELTNRKFLPVEEGRADSLVSRLCRRQDTQAGKTGIFCLQARNVAKAGWFDRRHD